MFHHSFHRCKWRLLMFVVVLTSSGCAGPATQSVATSAPQASPTVVVGATAIPGPSEESTSTATAAASTAPALEAASRSGTDYEDNFTDPTSGWPNKVTYDNYFIGYHEPEYYHVEITSPDLRVQVIGPRKDVFNDFTVEVKAFTFQPKTDPSGDFRYGIVFRRSGDKYYAFAISPRTKHWYVLKSSPDSFAELKVGSEESIRGQDVDTEDTLQVDAEGSVFSFHINGKLVTQLSDPDYSSGQVGFYVQTIDSTRVHIHFDSIAIRNVQVPKLCSFGNTALYMRSGPGTKFSPIATLAQGDKMEPLERTFDGSWIIVRAEGTNQVGWVARDWVSCNTDLKELKVAGP